MSEPAHRCPGITRQGKVCNLPAYLSFYIGHGQYAWFCTFHLPDRRLEPR